MGDFKFHIKKPITVLEMIFIYEKKTRTYFGNTHALRYYVA